MASLDDKTAPMAHNEDIESARNPSKDSISQDRKASVKHGDRALAIVGDQRIELTEEDVCENIFHVVDWILIFSH